MTREDYMSGLQMQVEVINKGKKEQIIVDGEVFLKSVAAGKWNYIVRISYTDSNGKHKEFDGKSTTRENAEKWQPWALQDEYFKGTNGEFSDLARSHIDASNGAWKVKNGVKYYVVPFSNITREIVEIER